MLVEAGLHFNLTSLSIQPILTIDMAMCPTNNSWCSKKRLSPQGWVGVFLIACKTNWGTLFSKSVVWPSNCLYNFHAHRLNTYDRCHVAFHFRFEGNKIARNIIFLIISMQYVTLQSPYITGMGLAAILAFTFHKWKGATCKASLVQKTNRAHCTHALSKIKS
jgi:hypothetical protein